MDEFLDSYYIKKLSQDEMSISTIKIEEVKKCFSSKKWT